MTNFWILIANSSEAKIYAASKLHSDWQLVKEFKHEEGREKDGELVSDKAGNFPNISRGSSSFSEPTDPKVFEEERFAHHLAEELNSGRTHNQYQKLVLVAGPRFHGMLNKHCNPHVLGLVAKNIEKDYVQLSEHELLKHLREQL